MINNHTRLLFALSLASTSITSLANTECDPKDQQCVYQQLKEVKKELEELKKQSSKTGSSEIIEKKIAKATEKSEHKISRIESQLNQEKERLKIRGFLSAGLVKGTEDVSWGLPKSGETKGPLDLDNDINFKTDSTLGLQLDLRISDRTTAVAQLVSRGPENYSTQAEWVFMKFEVQKNLNIRAGRMRNPYYLFSESIEVGYTYPWVRPPLDVYRTDFAAIIGTDLLYEMNFLGWTHTVQILRGDVENEYAHAPGTKRITLESSHGPWRTKFMHSYGKTEIKSIGASSVTKAYIGGIMYDDLDWLAIAEFSRFDASNEGPVPTIDAWYTTFGYHIGRWLPNITFSKFETTERNDHPFAAIAVLAVAAGEGNRTAQEANSSITLGLRYDISTQLCVKTEYQRVIDVEEVDGIKSNGAYLGGFDTLDAGDDIEFYSIAVDMIF